ncbi:MAG: sel1 repeat family protein [Magnetococcales bacterium]|nr:sel1 repeat family protein [Magnetococcales bacterium]
MSYSTPSPSCDGAYRRSCRKKGGFSMFAVRNPPTFQSARVQIEGFQRGESGIVSGRLPLRWILLGLVLLIGSPGSLQAGTHPAMESDSATTALFESARRAIAEEGSARAEADLALLYLYGPSDVRNLRQARHWFQSAARKGDPRAMFHLADIYQKGVGVKKDPHKALFWLRALMRRDPSRKIPRELLTWATLKLGYIHDVGIDGVSNRAEAFRWYRRAAEQGAPMGQYMLGRMYARGQGVRRNLVLAYRWLRLAAEGGHPDAPEELARITPLLPPRMVEAGR